MGAFFNKERLSDHSAATSLSPVKRLKSFTKNASEQTISLLNFYLCIHGLAKATSFKWTIKHCFLFLGSTLFMLTNEFTKLYQLANIFFIIYDQSEKRLIVFGVLMLMEWFLRILFWLKRKNLDNIIHLITVKYNFSNIQNLNLINFKLALLLILNDINTIFNFTSYALAYKSFRSPLETWFINHLIAPKYFLYCFSYFLGFMLFWGSAFNIVPIYFCLFCFVLRKAIKSVEKGFAKVEDLNIEIHHEAVKEIVQLTFRVNKVFHNILLFFIVEVLVWLFFHSYIILFQYPADNNYELAFHLLSICCNFIRLNLICFYASSVSKAVLELKNAVHDLPVKPDERWKHLIFITKMNVNGFEFKLLDKITLEKSFVLAAAGCLSTYGLMLANLNVNS